MSSRRMSLLVRNLRYESSPERVRKYFEQFGEIRDVYLPLHYHTKKPRGFGFVEFFDDRDAHECLRQTHKTILDGNEISVTIAQQGRKSPDTMRVREVRQRDDGSESWSGQEDDRGGSYRSRSRSYSPYGGERYGGRGGGGGDYMRRGRNSRRDDNYRRDDYPPRDRNRDYDRRQRGGSRSRGGSITPEEGRGRGGYDTKGIRSSGSKRDYSDSPRRDRTRRRRETSHPVRNRGASSDREPLSRSVSASPNNFAVGDKFTDSPRHNFHQNEYGAEGVRSGNWRHSDGKKSVQYRSKSPNRVWKSRSGSRDSAPSDGDVNPEEGRFALQSVSLSRSRSRSRSVASDSCGVRAPEKVMSEIQTDGAVDREIATKVVLSDSSIPERKHMRDNRSPRDRSISPSPSRSRSRS